MCVQTAVEWKNLPSPPHFNRPTCAADPPLLGLLCAVVTGPQALHTRHGHVGDHLGGRGGEMQQGCGIMDI